MNPELHAKQSPASNAPPPPYTVKRQNTGLDVYAACVLCPLMPMNSSADSFLLQMQRGTAGYRPKEEKKSGGSSEF